MFGIVVYGFYFGTCIALAHAASEGARASVAGITAGERATFAEEQVRAIFARYAPLLSDDEAQLAIAAAPASEPGLFTVTEIGRAHVRNPDTKAQIVCRLH